MQLLAAGFADGTLQFYSANSLRLLSTGRVFGGKVTAVEWSDEGVLYVGSE